MSIANFPQSLQSIIQQGSLARRFQTGLKSTLNPTPASANTGLDNGMTPTSWTVEQYTMGIDLYNDTQDLNMVSEGVGIARQFLINAEVNGAQAMQSLDRIARNTLFYGNSTGSILDVGGYLGGKTRVVTALEAAGSTLHVDDIRGFVNSVVSLGVVQPVSNANPLVVYVNGNSYSMIGVTPDGGANASTAPRGMSDTIQFSANLVQADGAAGASVVAFSAPSVIRPNGRGTTAALVAGDTLSFKSVQSAVTKLRRNAVPTIDGLFNCHLSDEMLQGLFDDQQFQNMFRGAYQSREFRQDEVFELMGVRFIPTTEAPQQTLGGLAIQRALFVEKGALVEGDYADTGYSDIPDLRDSLKEYMDGICMMTRPPLDRLDMQIAQSWYWIGGFALPTDVTANPLIIPTATSAALKRGVVIESL